MPAISRGDEARSGEIGKPAAVLLSALQLLLMAIDTVLLAPVVVAVALVDQRAAYHVCLLWARVNLLLYGVRVHVRRLAPLDPRSTFVFMSNHRSQFDILAVIAALGDFQLRWVAKKELTRVPVFGWALKHSGHIVIDRSDSRQAVASLRAARAQMCEGISVVIFPEGTRSPPGQALLPFKKGGFMLALETGFPIVPVVVRGSDDVLPRGSWRPAPGDIEVVVGLPLMVTGLEREELMARVRAFMLDQIARPAEAAGSSAAGAT